MISAENITIIEKLPASFMQVIADNAIVQRNATQNETWITWNFDRINANEQKNLTYQFIPPQISPAIYLLGPVSVNYDNNVSFTERKGWSVIVADVSFYFFNWYIRDGRDNTTIIDPGVLCAGQDYTVRLTVAETAEDDDASTSTWELQAFENGVFGALPTTGFTLRDVETNPHTDLGTVLGIGDTCNLLSTDKCEWGGPVFIWNISIANTVTPGDYKFKIVPGTRPTGSRFDTDKLDIKVINCTNINLFRPITVFSPSGEKNKVIKGHTANIVLPLANYNTSTALDSNATLQIYDGSTLQDWFIVEGVTQNIGSIAASASQPATLNNRTIQWHVQVPDNVDGSKTYTARITVNSTADGKVLERTFTPYNDLGTAIDVILTHTTSRIVSSILAERAYRRINVCNFGDYNITVNITDFAILTTGGTSSTPAPSSATTGVTKWNNQNIITSSCFIANTSLAPTTDTGEEEFTLEAKWFDPGSSQSLSIEECSAHDWIFWAINTR